MAPEGLTRDGGEADSDFAEDQNEDNPVPRIDFDSHSPLPGNNRCKSGADASNWAVRFYFVWYAHQDYLGDSTFFIGGGSSCYRPKKRIK